MQWYKSAAGFVMFCSAAVLKPIYKYQLSVVSIPFSLEGDSKKHDLLWWNKLCSELNSRLPGLDPAQRSVPSTPQGESSCCPRRHQWPTDPVSHLPAYCKFVLQLRASLKDLNDDVTNWTEHPVLWWVSPGPPSCALTPPSLWDRRKWDEKATDSR